MIEEEAVTLDSAAVPTVLVVDDDASMRDLFALVLGQTAFNVRCAATIDEARRSLQQSTPDLILLDLHLSDTDGLCFANELSQLLHGRDVPILAVSASTDLSIPARVREAGCAGFLPKPINPRSFGKEVKQYLNHHRSRIAANTVFSKRAEVSLAQLRMRFVDEALRQIDALSARDNADLLSDNALSDAAHRWAGVSNLEGLPNVSALARTLEIAGKGKRFDQIGRIRKDLQRIRDQFEQSR